MSIVYYNPNTNQYFTRNTSNPINQTWGQFASISPDYAKATPSDFNNYLNRGYIKLIGSPQASESSFNSASISKNYTPNQFTANQLAGMNGNGSGMGGNANTIPRWMQQSYANKMAGYGSPANGPLPYKLTDSSFRGMPASANQVAPVGVGGKARPAGGV